jgi:hypothetical protein
MPNIAAGLRSDQRIDAVGTPIGASQFCAVPEGLLKIGAQAFKPGTAGLMTTKSRLVPSKLRSEGGRDGRKPRKTTRSLAKEIVL